MGNRSYAMVASALGHKLGVEVSIGGNQAYSTGGHIRLPALPDDSKHVEIAWGYLMHEGAGHEAFTDFDEVNRRTRGHPPLYGHLWNIFEDIWIEQAAGRRYPGIPRMIDNVVHHMVETGGFAAPAPGAHPAQVLTSYLLLMGRYRHVGQAMLKDMAEQTEQAMRAMFGPIAAQLEQVLAAAGSVTSTKAAFDLADQVWALLDLQSNPPPPPPQAQQGQRGNQGGDGQSDDAAGEPDEGSGSQQSGEASGQPQAGDQDGDDSPGSDSAGAGQGDAGDAGDDPKDQGASSGAEGDAAASDADQGASSGGNSQPDDRDGQAQGTASQSGAGTSSPGSDNASQGNGDGAGGDGATDGGDSPSDAAAAAEAAEAARQAQAYQDGDGHDVVSDLAELLKHVLESSDDIEHRELMMRTSLVRERPSSESDEVIRIARAQSGPLRRSLLQMLQANARTKRWHAEEGKRLKSTRLSRLAAGDPRVFARKQQHRDVHTAISLVVDFSSSMRGAEEQVARQAAAALAVAIEAIPGTSLEFSVFPYVAAGECLGIVKTFDERVAHLKRRLMSPRAINCTPMGEAMMAAGGRLLQRREPRKVMIVVTDGAPNSGELVLRAKAALEGVEFVGIGICSMAVKQLFDHYLVISSAEELPRELLTTVKSLLAA